MLRFSKQRRGASLLELLVVVSLLGLFAGLATARLMPDTAEDHTLEGDARRFALECELARRRAIKTGDDHYVLLSQSGGLWGFQTYRVSGSATAIGQRHDFDDDTTVSASSFQARFQFDGTATASIAYTLTGTRDTWRVSTIQATGNVSFNQL